MQRSLSAVTLVPLAPVALCRAGVLVLLVIAHGEEPASEVNTAAALPPAALRACPLDSVAAVKKTQLLCT